MGAWCILRYTSQARACETINVMALQDTEINILA